MGGSEKVTLGLTVVKEDGVGMGGSRAKGTGGEDDKPVAVNRGGGCGVDVEFRVRSFRQFAVCDEADVTLPCGRGEIHIVQRGGSAKKRILWAGEMGKGKGDRDVLIL